MRRLFRFPNPVNEIAARAVAAGVVVQSLAFVFTGWRWLVVPLAFGFVARVASGPTFSPLGRVATQVVVPRLRLEARLVPGPPKRFAQGIGAVCLTVASLVMLGGYPAWSYALCVVVGAFAALEATVGFCFGCWAYRQLAARGLVEPEVCVDCTRLGAAATHGGDATPAPTD